jgi:hypothetical protein
VILPVRTKRSVHVGVLIDDECPYRAPENQSRATASLRMRASAEILPGFIPLSMLRFGKGYFAFNHFGPVGHKQAQILSFRWVVLPGFRNESQISKPAPLYRSQQSAILNA